MEQNYKNNLVDFFIFTFNFDITLLEVYYREVILNACR